MAVCYLKYTSNKTSSGYNNKGVKLLAGYTPSGLCALMLAGSAAASSADNIHSVGLDVRVAVNEITIRAKPVVSSSSYSFNVEEVDHNSTISKNHIRDLPQNSKVSCMLEKSKIIDILNSQKLDQQAQNPKFSPVKHALVVSPDKNMVVGSTKGITNIRNVSNNVAIITMIRTDGVNLDGNKFYPSHCIGSGDNADNVAAFKALKNKFGLNIDDIEMCKHVIFLTQMTELKGENMSIV